MSAGGAPARGAAGPHSDEWEREDGVGMRWVKLAASAAVALAGGVAAAAYDAAVAAPTASHIEIPAGVAPVVDGVVGDEEWRDAVRVTIRAGTGREVDVLLKHDGTHLHAAFTNLAPDGAELYPELLVGAAADAGAAWQPTDHWFHASYQDCDGAGRFNDYSTCAPSRPGWTASNFPLRADVPDGARAGVEMSISLERIGVSAGAGTVVRLAANVTDTRERWLFWPDAASLDAPGSWATATLR